MADVKISAITDSTTAPAATDVFVTVESMGGTPVTKRKAWSVLKTAWDLLYGVHKVRGLVSNPQAMYAQRAQIVLFRAEAAITITRIHIHGADLTPTSELAGDLKFADDVNTGGFANATIIDVCDTTNGVFTATSSFDDATVPSGKYVYFQMDASPHADWKDYYLEVYYTVD